MYVSMHVHSYYLTTNVSSLCRDNINIGHSVDSDNALLAVQTPAVDFVILNQTVSPYQSYSYT